MDNNFKYLNPFDQQKLSINDPDSYLQYEMNIEIPV